MLRTSLRSLTSATETQPLVTTRTAARQPRVRAGVANRLDITGNHLVEAANLRRPTRKLSACRRESSYHDPTLDNNVACRRPMTAQNSDGRRWRITANVLRTTACPCGLPIA